MKALRAVDLFCGAGGTSTGLAQAAGAAGLRLELLAVNHWDVAIETHSANHPEARHLCATLDSIDPRKVCRSMRARLDLLIASPECMHHSIARGGKPINDQSRASAWEVLRWVEALRPRCVLVENVREFQSWGPLGSDGRPLKRRRGETFAAWLQALRSLGYVVEHRVLNAASYGDATTRQRLFVLAIRGRPCYGVAWPEPTHERDPQATLFTPLPRWRAAREVIDWSLPGQSICGRKRPLRPSTLRRIATGLRKFCGSAFVVGTMHTHNGDRCRAINDPLPTVTGVNELGLCQPFLVSYYGTGGPQSVEAPLPTITASGNHLGLCQPFIVPANYGERPGQAPRCHSIDAPVPTVVGSGTHALVQPVLQMSQSGSNSRRMQPADDGEIVEPFLISYYGTGGPKSVNDPLDTVTAKDRFGLVMVDGRLDVCFRMLQPHELAAAMSFPAGYRFAGCRSDVVRQIGNAVPVKTAAALCGALCKSLKGMS